MLESRRPGVRTRRCRAIVRILTAALLGVLVLQPVGSSVVRAAGPGDRDRALYQPVLEEQRDAIFDATEGDLSRYRIIAQFTPATDRDPAIITGEIDLLFVNRTGESLDHLPFRLYPNIDAYSEGGMTITGVSLAGDDLRVRTSVGDTVATVSLPEPVADGEAIELRIGFETIVPTDPIGSYGMFSFDRRNGTYALAHWIPLLAGFDPIDGWLLDPPSRNGDPVFTNAALFDVSINAPSEFVLVTTGSQIDSVDEDDGTTTHQFVSGPVRDFVMAIDDDFEVESRHVGGTTVNSYFNPDSREGGLTVLDAGASSLAVYSDLIGEYPYEELDLVEVDLGNGAGGVEFPQLTFIGSDYYSSGSVTSIPNFLEFIVAHEVGHQWFYGLVGNNQYLHAFMDEGLTNFLTTVYFGEEYGAEVEHTQVNYNLKASYFSLLFDDLDEVVDQPTDDFGTQRSYGATIYGKAALGFAALRDEIGNDAFFAALQSYFDEFEFSVATPDDLKAAFEDASGENLDAFWRHWFERAEGREDFDAADLAVLLREIGR